MKVAKGPKGLKESRKGLVRRTKAARKPKLCKAVEKEGVILLMYKDRTVFESILNVIGGFKNNLSKRKKIVALFLCAFALQNVWRVVSRLHCPTTLPLTYVRESGT